MPNITLVINEELKKQMEKHSSIKWSSVVRNIIEQKLKDFAEADDMARKSRFSIKDWSKISQKLSKASARHAEALLHESNR